MKFEYSAGGVVVKKEGKKTWILLCQHSQHHGWVFPKGLIGDTDKTETKETTAIREVKEECGIDGEIVQPLTPVTYWYVWEKEKRKKTVYYFLMNFVRGDITKHDDEMENVEWLLPKDVHARLTYPSDKKIWEEAQSLIANG